MPIEQIVLEYLKVILSAPVMFSVVTGVLIYIFKDDVKKLIKDIKTFKFPGGPEFSTKQSTPDEPEDSKPPLEPPTVPIQGIPQGLTHEQQGTVENLIRSHISTAYLWEYRYLNYFLARSTQHVLDWFAGRQSLTTLNEYDTFWMQFIPSADERVAILSALKNHHLVLHDQQSGAIAISPKGQEYRGWRGDLAPPNPPSNE